MPALQVSVALLSEASKLVKNSRRACNPGPTSRTRSFHMFSGADMPSSAFPVDGFWGFDGLAMTFGADEVAFARGLWVVRLAAVVDALVFAEAAGDAAEVGVVGVVEVSGVTVGVTLPADFLRARLG